MPGVSDSSRHLHLGRFTATDTRPERGGTRCVCVHTHHPADKNGRRTPDMRAPVLAFRCWCAWGAPAHAHLHPACVLMHMSGRAGLGRDHSASFSRHIRLRPFRPCERAGSVRVPEKPDAAWSTSPWASRHVRSNAYTDAKQHLQTHACMQQPHGHGCQAHKHHHPGGDGTCVAHTSRA